MNWMDVLKLKQINIGQTKLRDKEIPEEDEDKQCWKKLTDMADRHMTATSLWTPGIEIEKYATYVNIDGRTEGSDLIEAAPPEEVACWFLDLINNFKIDDRIFSFADGRGATEYVYYKNYEDEVYVTKITANAGIDRKFLQDIEAQSKEMLQVTSAEWSKRYSIIFRASLTDFHSTDTLEHHYFYIRTVGRLNPSPSSIIQQVLTRGFKENNIFWIRLMEYLNTDFYDNVSTNDVLNAFRTQFDWRK